MTELASRSADFIGLKFNLDCFERSYESVVKLDLLANSLSLRVFGAFKGDAHYHLNIISIEYQQLVSKLLSDTRPRVVINFVYKSLIDCSIQGSSNFIQINIVGILNLHEFVRSCWN